MWSVKKRKTNNYRFTMANLQMIVTVKFFHEKTKVDHEEYDNLWMENKERVVFLSSGIQYQLSDVRDQMDTNKDILSIRFPSITFLHRSKIFNSVIMGHGVAYENAKTWYPSEVWVYSPVKN
jgi:hypothetical protein